MPISTIHVYLMKGTLASGVVSYVKLADIKDFPDMGGNPELLETTTLSNEFQTFIPGVKSQSGLEFTMNWDFAIYSTLLSLSADNYYEIRFGVNGEKGKFRVQGQSGAWVVGGGVNSVVDMKFIIVPSTHISKVPKVGVLAVTSTAGGAGKTSISVTPSLGSGNSYVYKTAVSVALPMYDDICNSGTGYTIWNGTSEITAVSGHEIVIVEKNSLSQARKTGKKTVVIG